MLNDKPPLGTCGWHTPPHEIAECTEPDKWKPLPEPAEGKCGNEFKLRHGYFCGLTSGHAGDHEATCPNPQFHQSWTQAAPVSAEPVITPEQFYQQRYQNNSTTWVPGDNSFAFATAYAAYHTAHVLEEERAKLTKLLPESFYADGCLAFRMELLVDNWKRATKANQILEDELAKLRAALAALEGKK